MRCALCSLCALCLLLTGCPPKEQKVAAKQDDAYQPPPAKSLDTMDAQPRYSGMNDTRGTEAPPEPTDAGMAAKPVQSADEPLAPSKSSKAGRTYVVQKGDTLSKISQKMYGDKNRWKRIYDANKTRIKNPNKLSVGAKLIIP